MAFEMESLFPRALNSCTGNKQWYVCTAGDFRGCCSMDPCITGICTDSDDDGSSNILTDPPDISVTTAVVIKMLPSVTPRTTTTSVATLPEPTIVSSTDVSTTASEPSSTSFSSTSEAPTGSETPTFLETPPVPQTSISRVTPATSEVLTISDTSIATEPTGVTALSSVLAGSGANASPTSTPSSNKSTGSSNRGAIIGGVAGGVAVLIICALLIFCCCRRKKKYGKRSPLVAWYPYGSARKNRAVASEVKSPLSSPDSEANKSLSTVSASTHNPGPNVALSPELTLQSSTTNLISHSPDKTISLPPIPPHSIELFASVPPRHGFTPELPDTGFIRLRAELASHAQSELINVPIEQRQRQQNPLKTRTGPPLWESPLTPTASQRATPGMANGSSTGHSHSNSNGGCPAHNPAGRVITAEGVVLGANLDRYSNGMEIGESQVQRERVRTAERGDADHVMSFMQYGGEVESRRSGEGLGIAMADHVTSPQGRGRSTPDLRPRLAERSLEEDEIATAEGVADVPPAYEAEEGAAGHDIKSPSGRIGMGMRRDV